MNIEQLINHHNPDFDTNVDYPNTNYDAAILAHECLKLKKSIAELDKRLQALEAQGNKEVNPSNVDKRECRKCGASEFYHTGFRHDLDTFGKVCANCKDVTPI